MKILLPPSFLEMLPQQDRANVLLAVAKLQQAFKHPHEHSGLGLRKLRPHIWEIRINLDIRVVFRLFNDVAEIDLVGNHDDVQRYLKSIR